MWKRSTSLSCSRLHKNIPSLLGDETCCSWDSRRMEFEYRIHMISASKREPLEDCWTATGNVLEASGGSGALRSLSLASTPQGPAGLSAPTDSHCRSHGNH
ncbi:hypothetical protein KC347_g149 [Hortaea werneckii]|nr:hypothetical protein KC347_g149 [Hortaea werneckii]